MNKQEDIDALCEANIMLVYKIVNQWIKSGKSIPYYEFEDMIQCGSLGLVEAARSFDPERGVRFGTLATTCISNRLRMALRYETESLRIPQNHVSSLDGLMDATPDGCSPDFYTPSVQFGEDEIIALIDVEKLGLTDEERIILDMRRYFDQSELEQLGFPIWKQDAIRTKARELYGVRINRRREQDKDRKREVRANNREEYNTYQRELMRRKRKGE